MSEEHKQYATSAAATLEAHILSVHSAKNEAEWWANREILRLRAENEKLRAALEPLVAELDGCPNDDYEHVLVSFADLRAAAAALKETTKGNNES